MTILLSPIARLLDRLRFSAKFTLLFIIVIIPLVAISGVLIKQFRDEAVVLANERLGLRFIEALKSPVEHLQQHRGMTSAYRNGATQFKERIAAKRQEIEQDLALLADADRELRNVLQLKDQVARIKQSWETIKAGAMEQPLPAVIKAHNDLIAACLTLISEVSDMSGIILDPKLDSFHLGFALTSDLPRLIETMGQTRALASGIAANGEFKGDSLAKLYFMVANIETHAQTLEQGLNSAVIANPKIGENLRETREHAGTALNAMLNLIRQQLLASGGITATSDQVYETSTAAISRAYVLYNRLIEELDGLFTARSEQADLKLNATAIALVAVMLSVVLILLGLKQSIIRNIAAINSATQCVARNDLTQILDIRSDDEMKEIADHFNAMIATTSALLREIIHTSDELQASSSQVFTVAKQSAANIEQQRQETTAVATAVTEMNATIHQVAASTQSAAQAASDANDQAQNGRRTVTGATQAMADLATDVEDAAGAIQELERCSNSIGAVLDVIKSIAEQTNLLALNAAIEAARAGEHGRGFAVVADEVRTLSSRTQQSTATIETMIAQLQEGARKAVSVMRQSQNQAQISVERAQDAMRALEAISDSVSSIDNMNLQIAGAAEQQIAVTEEINRNIIHITNLSEQAAEGARQTTSSAGQLNRLAEDLNRLIGEFKIAK